MFDLNLYSKIFWGLQLLNLVASIALGTRLLPTGTPLRRKYSLLQIVLLIVSFDLLGVALQTPATHAFGTTLGVLFYCSLIFTMLVAYGHTKDLLKPNMYIGGPRFIFQAFDNRHADINDKQIRNAMVTVSLFATLVASAILI